MIHCTECRKVMEHITTTRGGNYERQVFVCQPCKIRCVVEKQYYYDADHPNWMTKVMPTARETGVDRG